MLTAADGEGQQCKAAPACTASTELEANGSLEISALTRTKFLDEQDTYKIVIKLPQKKKKYRKCPKQSRKSLKDSCKRNILFGKVILLLNEVITLTQHCLREVQSYDKGK